MRLPKPAIEMDKWPLLESGKVALSGCFWVHGDASTY